MRNHIIINYEKWWLVSLLHLDKLSFFWSRCTSISRSFDLTHLTTNEQQTWISSKLVSHCINLKIKLNISCIYDISLSMLLWCVISVDQDDPYYHNDVQTGTSHLRSNWLLGFLQDLNIIMILSGSCLICSI